jgi:hypothetical protein
MRFGAGMGAWLDLGCCAWGLQRPAPLPVLLAARPLMSVAYGVFVATHLAQADVKFLPYGLVGRCQNSCPLLFLPLEVYPCSLLEQ